MKQDVKPLNYQDSVSLIVYTAILGGYDTLPTLSSYHATIRYICFTDTPEAFSSSDSVCENWLLVPISSFFVDKKIMNGFLKSNSDLLFGKNTISVWIDANLKRININPEFIIKAVSETPIATPPHRQRSRVAEETDIVISLGLEHRSSAIKNLRNITAQGYQD
ncbi:hypothetical protein V6O07_11495, partial [Arthrospira platensis SPKY2]